MTQQLPYHRLQAIWLSFRTEFSFQEEMWSYHPKAKHSLFHPHYYRGYASLISHTGYIFMRGGKKGGGMTGLLKSLYIKPLAQMKYNFDTPGEG